MCLLAELKAARELFCVLDAITNTQPVINRNDSFLTFRKSSSSLSFFPFIARHDLSSPATHYEGKNCYIKIYGYLGFWYEPFDNNDLECVHDTSVHFSPAYLCFPANALSPNNSALFGFCWRERFINRNCGTCRNWWYQKYIGKLLIAFREQIVNASALCREIFSFYD